MNQRYVGNVKTFALLNRFNQPIERARSNGAAD